MGEVRALCLLGGVYHPFDDAEAFYGDELPGLGVTPYFTRDYQVLGRVSRADTDLVFIYTCLHETLPEEAAANLARYVESGGRVFGLHGATASFQDCATYIGLLGARFVEHGPRHSFFVTPLQRLHPVTAGVDAFAVHDELYVQEYAADIQIHAVAGYLGKAQPVVWTRTPGAGRVYYLALGHDRAVWEQAPVRRLVANGVAWLMEPK